MSARVAPVLLAGSLALIALAGCVAAPAAVVPSFTPIAQAPPTSGISILPAPSQSSPSPLLQVRIGHVRGLIPKSWKAEMLPKSQLAREGFVASPDLAKWERGQAFSQGIEAFWIDGARLRIPSFRQYHLGPRP